MARLESEKRPSALIRKAPILRPNPHAIHGIDGGRALPPEKMQQLVDDLTEYDALMKINNGKLGWS